MIKSSFAIAATAVTVLSLVQPAMAQSDDSKLGTVNFETSCNPEAQKLFNRAMLYQHSFWYRASQQVFEDALKADPECGIAYWGIALSLLWNPHPRRPRRTFSRAPPRSQRERASAPRPNGSGTIWTPSVSCTPTTRRSTIVPHSGLREGHGTTRPALSRRRRGPDPLCAGAQYLGFTGRQDLRQPAQGRGDSGADRNRQPEHPGVSHYLIHLYDYPPIAEKGLNAARRYAKIAPAAAHAQHMPSHIFTRVGYWTRIDRIKRRSCAGREGGGRPP